MRIEHIALLSAMCSSMFFAAASVVFARFSSEVSVLWMNCFKAFICALGMLIVLLFHGLTPVSTTSIGFLAASGAIGLGIGDLFLLSAFARIGASRSLMIFGFQPVLIGIGSAILFGQPIGPERMIAIGFFMACLFLLSFERYKSEGHWELKGLLFALAGVVLDNTGILMTRMGFEGSPGLDSFEANLIRSLGALAVFVIISFLIRPIHLYRKWIELPSKDRNWVTIASFAGTALSLSFYMFAIKYGHLASIGGVVLSGPLFSAIIECVTQKKRPSPYLIGGLLCLMVGMGIALSATIPSPS